MTNSKDNYGKLTYKDLPDFFKKFFKDLQGKFPLLLIKEKTIGFPRKVIQKNYYQIKNYLDELELLGDDSSLLEKLVLECILEKGHFISYQELFLKILEKLKGYPQEFFKKIRGVIGVTLGGLRDAVEEWRREVEMELGRLVDWATMVYHNSKPVRINIPKKIAEKLRVGGEIKEKDPAKQVFIYKDQFTVAISRYNKMVIYAKAGDWIVSFRDWLMEKGVTVEEITELFWLMQQSDKRWNEYAANLMINPEEFEKIKVSAYIKEKGGKEKHALTVETGSSHYPEEIDIKGIPDWANTYTKKILVALADASLEGAIYQRIKSLENQVIAIQAAIYNMDNVVNQVVTQVVNNNINSLGTVLSQLVETNKMLIDRLDHTIAINQVYQENILSELRNQTDLLVNISNRLEEREQQQYNRIFITGHARRRQIVDILERGPRTVEEIAAEIGISYHSIYYHLKSLLGMGIVEYREEITGRGRPKKVYFLSRR